MSSRLDRLFLLLETGSSPITRKAAALQLGEVQKLHPHELHNLLGKVRNYLHSSSWDTRIAAGHAVEAIIMNIPQWNPAGLQIKSESEVSSVPTESMRFSGFNINHVINNGRSLLASEGKEYELTASDSKLDAVSKERLAKERLMQTRRCGFFENLGMDARDVISTDDLKIIDFPDLKNGEGASAIEKKQLSEMFPSAAVDSIPSGSQLESNKMKRKSQLTKQKSKDGREDSLAQNDVSEEDNPKKLRRVTSVLVQQPSDDSMLLDNVPDNNCLWEESTEWPLSDFCQELCMDLFSCSWEVRHGAATALRDVIRLHGKGGGKRSDIPANELEELNQMWLENTALRLLCVLALDKFGDFISDQVVAPVRETCAQALGSLLPLMRETGVEGVLSVLLDLLTRPEWEARHGGLLAMKYLIALKQDRLSHLMPIIFEPIFNGLQDPIDDVSAVAAAALVPITDALVQTFPNKIPEVVTVLWSMLLELDDLTASTSNILTLLASLLSYPLLNSGSLLSSLVPRLWPFLGHNSSSVRKSVLQALLALTMPNNLATCREWIPEVLPDALRLIYQRCLVEHDETIQEQLYLVWQHILSLGKCETLLRSLLSSVCPYLSGWLCLIMHPSKAPLDPSIITVWFQAKHKAKDKSCTPAGVKNRNALHSREGGTTEPYYIGGSEAHSESLEKWEKNIMRARCMAAKFLGLLSIYVTQPMPGVVYTPEMESPLDCFAKLLLFHLNSKSALQRLAIALLLSHWAQVQQENPCPLPVKECCLLCLTDNVFYDEIALAFTRMQQESLDFISCLRHHKLPIDSTITSSTVLTTDQIQALSTTVFTEAVAKVKLRAKILETLQERRKSLQRILKHTTSSQATLSTLVQASLACALVSLKFLPDKLNPIIRPLMDSLKKEENDILRKSSAKNLVCLMEQCLDRPICPNSKIVKNLIGLVCGDPLFFPCVNPEAPHRQEDDNDSSSGSYRSNSIRENPYASTKFEGILTLINMQKKAEKLTLRRINSTSRKHSTSIDSQNLDDTSSSEESQFHKELQRQGAVCALSQAAEYFGKDLPQKLPSLWETLVSSLDRLLQPNNSGILQAKSKDDEAQELATNLLILDVTAPSLHTFLHSQIRNLLPALLLCLEHSYTAVRHLASRCLGTLSRIITPKVMELMVGPLLDNLGATHCLAKRQGAVEAITCVVEGLGLGIVPYIVLLVVPMLGRMSDQNQAVRILATQTFASLVRLMPLESGVKDPPNLPPEILSRKKKERLFLDQLLDSKQAETYKVAVPIEAELRSYQQDGVNWLAFLNKYKLHGILCDDMGLGKTLQSLCILASDHYLRAQKYKENQSQDCSPLPSLVICPPTLTGHWMYEVEKFVSLKHLNPLHYTGPPSERARLRARAKKHNLIIASYDIVRNDVEFFSAIHWNYCILDEGHIIKNGKTKLAQAIKQLSANHRLILSGTPIQNNVLELWSLFDFLMPGFLGSEKQFSAKYSRPILQSRDAKSSSKEQETGVLALESLHRQVLPFVLRRMKEDVLQDLPPKIIQDYYCELSPLQVQLYEDFAKSRAHKTLEGDLEEDSPAECNPGPQSHVFQALQYLRKVCNHPKLVLNAQHPEQRRISMQLQQQNTTLADIQHAAKLSALKQLLLDCGIGVSHGPGSTDLQPAVNQHRALVFCQLKSMLDILENDLLKSHLPTVSYLRLDGCVAPGNRHSVVHRFNNDPSIDLLLLTTQVGGLGLNLTGADTVIFVEHDWNPMKDMQAMDRAHRIGQKKVVNVYRLITRGTLEEKIMGLQKFKMTVASTVITQENSSLRSMGTEQLLDLFLLDQTTTNNNNSKSATSSDSSNKGKGVRSVLETLPELWDNDQYESEYDLANFMHMLNK